MNFKLHLLYYSSIQEMRSVSGPGVLSTIQRQALYKELRILPMALNLLGVLWIREICTSIALCKYLKVAQSVGTKPKFKFLDLNTTTRCHYGETSLPTAIQCQLTQKGLSHSIYKVYTKLFYRAWKSTLVRQNYLEDRHH